MNTALSGQKCMILRSLLPLSSTPFGGVLFSNESKMFDVWRRGERALLGAGPDSTLMCIVCFSVLINVVNVLE